MQYIWYIMILSEFIKRSPLCMCSIHPNPMAPNQNVLNTQTEGVTDEMLIYMLCFYILSRVKCKTGTQTWHVVSFGSLNS
jgi:hypothetical protein